MEVLHTENAITENKIAFKSLEQLRKVNMKKGLKIAQKKTHIEKIVLIKGIEYLRTVR